MRIKLAAGNWKMNGVQASLAEISALSDHTQGPSEVAICPPATLVAAAVAIAGDVAIGGQDCHAKTSGAHTGDISAEMLKDAGATYVITGHSERREDHSESDADVNAKTQAGWAAGLSVILCIGESLEERESGATLDRMAAQLAASVPDGATGANLVIAYEPIWAIGTGKVPSLDEIAEVHAFIRKTLTDRFGDEGAKMRVLYGGSVKPSNAAEIFAVADVDGALVGGASLKAADFSGIIEALNAA